MKYGEQMSTGKESLTLQMIPLLHHKLLFSPSTGAKQPVHAGAYFRHSKSVMEESVLSQVTTAIQNAQEKISTPAMAP